MIQLSMIVTILQILNIGGIVTSLNVTCTFRVLLIIIAIIIILLPRLHAWIGSGVSGEDLPPEKFSGRENIPKKIPPVNPPYPMEKIITAQLAWVSSKINSYWRSREREKGERATEAEALKLPFPRPYRNKTCVVNRIYHRAVAMKLECIYGTCIYAHISCMQEKLDFLSIIL